jgi:hypothetical protein
MGIRYGKTLHDIDEKIALANKLIYGHVVESECFKSLITFLLKIPDLKLEAVVGFQGTSVSTLPF